MDEIAQGRAEKEKKKKPKRALKTRKGRSGRVGVTCRLTNSGPLRKKKFGKDERGGTWVLELRTERSRGDH